MNVTRRWLGFVLISAVVSWTSAAAACTTFLLEDGDHRLFGKSYDWSEDEGLVLINRAGVQKQAVPVHPADQPARWASKYASLTFNQYGREMPNGGMNTAGLVIEIMWLSSSVYPPRDQRPTVTELQWIQYMLDRFANVAEVVAHAPSIRVSSVYGKVHYLVCDKGGECAAFEYVDGKLVITQGADLPAKCLTNDTVASSQRFMRSVGHGGAPGGNGSLQRFARAAHGTRRVQAGTDVRAAAFGLLDDVRQGDYTKWNIVYDPAGQRVWFRTLRAPAIKEVSLAGFGGSCREPTQMLDMNAADGGDATGRFAAWTVGANRALLTSTTRRIARHLPPGAIEQLIVYPLALTCGAPQP